MMRRIHGPDTPWQRDRWEIPVVVTGTTIIWRDATTALGLTGIAAYSDIVEFTLTIWRRGIVDPFGHHRSMRRHDTGDGVSPEFLRVGVVVADGRTATNLDDVDAASDLVLASHGGFSGPGGEQQQYRMWPLPPPGPFALVVQWPVAGLTERHIPLDADAIRHAAGRVESAWPDATQPAP
jgi:hypothetical protein